MIRIPISKFPPVLVGDDEFRVAPRDFCIRPQQYHSQQITQNGRSASGLDYTPEVVSLADAEFLFAPVPLRTRCGRVRATHASTTDFRNGWHRAQVPPSRRGERLDYDTELCRMSSVSASFLSVSTLGRSATGVLPTLNDAGSPSNARGLPFLPMRRARSLCSARCAMDFWSRS